MIIGVPKEVKDHEARVGLLPWTKALVEAGHHVLAQAGAASQLAAGRRLSRRRAEIVVTAAELWKRTTCREVKEPQTV